MRIALHSSKEISLHAGHVVKTSLKYNYGMKVSFYIFTFTAVRNKKDMCFEKQNL